MKLKRIGTLLVIAVVAYVLYGSLVGFSSAVDDFEEDPNFDIDIPTQPTPDFPAAVVTFSYGFYVLGPYGVTATISEFTANIESYSQYDEARVYERSKFDLTGWFGPPSAPSVADLMVNITRGGAGGHWCWEKDVGSFQYGATISGETGRLVVEYAGSYGALIQITALVGGQFTVLGSQSITVEVSV